MCGGRCVVASWAGLVLAASLIAFSTPQVLAQAPPVSTPVADAPPSPPTPVPAGTPVPGTPPAPPVQVIRPLPFVPSADYLGTVGGNAGTLALRGVARAPMAGFEQLVARVFAPGGDDDLNVVFQTPPGLSYRSPAVQAVHGTLLSLVLGSVSSLLLLVGAANLALRRRWDLPVDESGMLLLRLLAASLAALVSLEVLGLAIELNNAVIRTLLAVPLCEPGANCRPHVFGTLGASFGRLTAIGLHDLDLIELLATLALGIVLLLLLIQHLVRIGLLSVLLAIAPVSFMLWVLPQTRWLARLWTSAFLSTLLAQPLQVLAYLLAAGLLALATPPGQASPGANIVSVLIGLATLGVSLSIPRLLRAGVGQLEAPLRTATKTVMLWTLADRLTGAGMRTSRRSMGIVGQLAPAPGPSARPTASGVASGWSAAPGPRRPATSHAATTPTSNTPPSPEFAAPATGDDKGTAARAFHGIMAHPIAVPTGGIAPDYDPASTVIAALLADPGATIYLADRATSGPPRPLTPGHGFSGSPANTDAMVTFADQRPDRHLTPAEIAALASLAGGVPGGGPAGNSPPSRLPSISAASNSAAMAEDGRPAHPARLPISLPPPLQYPARPTGRPARPPLAGEETTP